MLQGMYGTACNPNAAEEMKIARHCDVLRLLSSWLPTRSTLQDSARIETWPGVRPPQPDYIFNNICPPTPKASGEAVDFIRCASF
jgi:hypothetical protein